MGPYPGSPHLANRPKVAFSVSNFISAVRTSSVWIWFISWLSQVHGYQFILIFVHPAHHKYNQVAVQALSDPPFLCSRMGWGHSSVPFQRGKTGGLIRPHFPKYHLSKRVPSKDTSAHTPCFKKKKKNLCFATFFYPVLYKFYVAISLWLFSASLL